MSTSPVTGFGCAWVVDPHNYKHVLEVRPHVLRIEWHRPWFLEDDCDDVVANMALP